MSAIQVALVAEILNFVDSGKASEEQAVEQVDRFLKTPLGQRISAALKFEQALRQIENPIGFIQEEAERDGMLVNGGMLIALVKEASYYQDIARKVLKDIPKLGVL